MLINNYFSKYIWQPENVQLYQDILQGERFMELFCEINNQYVNNVCISSADICDQLNVLINQAAQESY